MGKNEKTPITVNDTEYFVEDMTDEQRTMLNHINDLGRKMDNARFNLDQLAVGRDAFVKMLAASLATETEFKDYYDVAHPAQTETETE